MGPTTFLFDLLDVVITYLSIAKGKKKKGLREILAYPFS